MLFFIPVLFLLSIIHTSSSEQINFVIPTNLSLPQLCNTKVCLTIDDYAQQAEDYFVPGATFEFLAGNHSLRFGISVHDTPNLTLTGDQLPTNSSSRIIVSQRASFEFIRCTNVTIKGLDFSAEDIPVRESISKIFSYESSRISIVDVNFKKPSGNISAMMASNSVVEIFGSTFEGYLAYAGAAILAVATDIIAVDCNFLGNRALSTGGAINIEASVLSLKRTNFINNTADYGGVIRCSNCTLNFTKVTFIENSALYYGGALYLDQSTVFVSGAVLFRSNKAQYGGAVAICISQFQYALTDPKHLQFIGNHATRIGGGILAGDDCDKGKGWIQLTGYFINNTAGECGGAVHSTSNDIRIDDAYFETNQGSALCFLNANVTFNGLTRLLRNTGLQGGGIYSQRSSISFNGPKNILYSNHALTGGAIYSVYSKITFSVNSLLENNKASSDGGALYALGTDVVLSNYTRFHKNSAGRGGAMYFEQSASITFDTSSRTYTTHNYAYEYGGAIYNRDIASRTQCSYEYSGKLFYLSYCFVHLNPQDLEQNTIRIFSYNDSSGKDGMFLYGGLLDRCQNNKEGYFGFTAYEWIRRYILKIVFIVDQNTTEYHRVPLIQTTTKKSVTSQPYQLCLCDDDLNYNCSKEKTTTIFKGQKIVLPLLALDQTDSLVSTTVKILKSSNTRLLPNQDPQHLQQKCSELTYNIFSNDTQELLVLHPESPCRESGLAGFTVNITLLPCPGMFQESGDHCVCEERLQTYANCFIDDTIYITRKPNTRFWMGAQYTQNGTYNGLILYNTCPADFCAKDLTTRWNLDTFDNQCSPNRSGELCGACTTNYSLMLGNSKCEVCSDLYLFLLPLFAVAGIILALFLSVLRLTIATGFLNSIILYSNIVQVNRSIFFSDRSSNVLTIFLAWMNLDFGFQVCLYNGMDAYIQTWLQFAFPVYVWILVGLIVFVSRYSITISKLIGHNPIAVLATVILMSYTKVLKIIIEVFSSVELEYPDNRKVVVWLKDANVPYLESKHLGLTVVTLLFLVFFFLPFTLILLLGYKLYRFSGKRCIRPFLKNLKPFLDSYYAPYKIHTRYWTGFLLLVRCALYIVFSYNSLGGTRKSLLAINVVFTALLIINWLSVYRNYAVTIVEGSVFLNLVILSTSALAGLDSPMVLHFLVGAVFAATLSIVVYHFHIAHTAKSAIWIKVKTYIIKIAERMKPRVGMKGKVYTGKDVDKLETTSPPVNPSKSTIDLREPLLENN